MLLVRMIWDRSLGLQSIPQLWSDLLALLHRTPSEVHLNEVNDDLVGFLIRTTSSNFEIPGVLDRKVSGPGLHR